MWSRWRKTSSWTASQEETLELAANEDIAHISGYSCDDYGTTSSLHVETSTGRRWEQGDYHFGSDYRSLRSSPAISNGLRLKYISGNESRDDRVIVRWLSIQSK